MYDNNKKEKLKTIIQRFLELSMQNLGEDKFKLFKLEYPKIFEALKSFNYTNGCINSIESALRRDKLKLNINRPNEIHFKNGYYDLATNKLLQRDHKKHFITKYINRDYNEPSKKEVKYIYDNILNKIFPYKNELEYLLVIQH